MTTCDAENVMILVMSDRKYRKTYIREWRERRGLSLRRLADRLELDGPDETSLSHASIGRIENGQQPYSQPIIEALAHALDVDVVDLIGTDPTKDGEVVDLVRLIEEKDREQAIRILRALTGTEG